MSQPLLFAVPASVRAVARAALGQPCPSGAALVLAKALAYAPAVSLGTVQAMAQHFTAQLRDQLLAGFTDATIPQRVLWDLHGGDPGRDWAAGVLDSLPRKVAQRQGD